VNVFINVLVECVYICLSLRPVFVSRGTKMATQFN